MNTVKAVANLTLKQRGFYRLQVYDPEGTCTKDTGFFENLITNQGLDQIGNSPYHFTSGIHYINTHASVGTGTTPPAFTDTQLTAFLAQFPTSAGGVEGSNTSSYTAGPPTYWSQIWKYTFPTGAAAGNLAEVGVGVFIAGDTQPRLFSHALIVDGSGNPTTITVLSNEILVLTYELRVYPNTTDTAYSFVLNGTTNESGIFRPSKITTIPPFYWDMTNSTSNVISTIYNGSIGPTTGSPSGSGSVAFNGRSGTGIGHSYTPGSYFESYLVTWDTTTPRLTISAFDIATSLGSWQFSVSPSIALTTGFSFQITINVSWARF